MPEVGRGLRKNSAECASLDSAQKDTSFLYHFLTRDVGEPSGDELAAEREE